MDFNQKKLISFARSAVFMVIQTILVIMIALFIQSKTFQPVVVEGPSMEPTFFEGDRSIVKTWDRKPEVNDIIIFNAKNVDPNVTDKSYYVKRVIGTPGDSIRVEDGHIYVNDKLVLQPYLKDNPEHFIDGGYERTTGSGSKWGDKNWDLSTISKDNESWKPEHQNTSVVPEGHYFVLGDHRSRSIDSRSFGYIPQESILGTVIGDK